VGCGQLVAGGVAVPVALVLPSCFL
jgi:hypothetical protein